MKHAINELQALLDTWGGQKDDEWRLSLTQATLSLMDLDSGEWELREVSEQHRADMAETSREENANGGPDVVRHGIGVEDLSWKNLADEYSKASEIPPFEQISFAQEIASQAIQSIVVCGIGAKQCGRTVEEEAALMIGKEIKIWSTVDLQCGNFRVFYTEKDDDLGELDTSKACDLSKEGGCEACQ